MLQIRERKADYLLALKGNQAALYADVKLFFAEKHRAMVWDEDEETDASHGRIEIRSSNVTSGIEWLCERHPEWKNLRSIAMIQSTRIQKKTHKQRTEMRYYISSLAVNAKEI